MKWDILVSSWLNEDTGSQRIRIQHRLQAPIMSTDKVLFEIAFKAGSVADPTVGTLIKYDMVRCQMEMNTNDNRFWVPTLTDGYYTKDASAVANQEVFSEWDIRPNPVNAGTSFKLFVPSLLTENTALSIYNASGIEIWSTEINSDNSPELEVMIPQNWSAGLYFAQLSNKQGARSVKKFVIK